MRGNRVIVSGKRFTIERLLVETVSRQEHRISEYRIRI